MYCSIEQFTLNDNTRYKILPRMFLPLSLPFMYADDQVHLVSPKFHTAFDANEWLLLPETRVIDAYYNSRNTCKLPNMDVRQTL